MFFSSCYPSPLGNLVLTGTGNHLSGLWITGQTSPEGLMKNDRLPVFAAGRRWLDDYFAGKRPVPSRLPLAPDGGVFRQTVWRLLMEIPYGETVTYGWLAKKTAVLLGKPNMSAQAIGGAVGHNPIPLMIPCHRVIGAHGNLTGYTGGLAIKIWLLRHEGTDMNALFSPGSR